VSNALQEAQTCFSVNEGHPIDGHEYNAGWYRGVIRPCCQRIAAAGAVLFIVGGII